MGAQARSSLTFLELDFVEAYVRLWLGLGFLMGLTLNAYAGTNPVPEIDATSGLAALAVVGSICALIWERRQRKRRPGRS